MTDIDALDVIDYRRKVHAIYSGVRDKRIPIEQRWSYWVAARDELIGHHPQSPLSAEQKASFSKLTYYPYDPALRFLVELDTAVQTEEFEIQLETDGILRMNRLGKATFSLGNDKVSLSVFRMAGYAGGIFLPFRDLSGQSYHGTRYLLDTIKGADLGMEENKLVLDFNFAYNPSCAYNPRWNCPLAPVENWLAIEINAGEQAYSQAQTVS